MPTAEGLRDYLCKDDDEGCKANAPSARTSHSNLLHSVPFACTLCTSDVRLCRQSNHTGGVDKAMHLEGHAVERNRDALVERTSPSTPEV